MPRGDSMLVSNDSNSNRTASRQAADCSLTLDDLIWLAGSICHLNAVAFDAELVRHRIASPCSLATLADVLAELGFETRAEDKFAPLHVAVTALADDVDRRAVPILVVRAESSAVDFFLARERDPSTLSSEEFARRRLGPWLIVRLRVVEPRDADTLQVGVRFGFRWFVPALVKHKQIWRDVLLASLAIQLLSLALPLMTQAIIDKVIVHRTESTLIALGSGLALFAVFSA